jgi:hypothetical protein
MANRDVKNSSARPRPGVHARKSGGGGMVAGIVIGLIVGVAVAVGLAMYLNRSATPFSNLEKLDRKAVPPHRLPNCWSPAPRLQMYRLLRLLHLHR